MSAIVLVVCRECAGASADHRLPPCGWCNCQGHEAINRAADGSVPATFDDGRPVTEWIPPTLVEVRPNPLVPLYSRCIP